VSEPERGLLGLRTDQFAAEHQSRAFYVWRLEDLLRDMQRARVDTAYSDPGADTIRYAFEQMMAAWYRTEPADWTPEPDWPQPGRHAPLHEPAAHVVTAPGHVRKLTPEQVREIRAEGRREPFSTLAGRYGVSTSAIGKVFHSQTYKWVKD
jgi:hypothetical protein